MSWSGMLSFFVHFRSLANKSVPHLVVLNTTLRSLYSVISHELSFPKQNFTCPSHSYVLYHPVPYSDYPEDPGDSGDPGDPELCIPTMQKGIHRFLGQLTWNTVPSCPYLCLSLGLFLVSRVDA
ncbi:hypothetical protein BDW67DRAFT_98674 [Aspergillus spinulosporus]